MAAYISQDDIKYSELLRKTKKDAPKQLYYKGNISLLKSDCLAVVGSRRMTIYGKQVAEKLVGQIAMRGITIVSGFMYGIDATAHKAAVEVGGKTIAVMPCGIERVHPEYQVRLYDDILKNDGLIVSEYERDMQPGYWSYPARNKIVAGISKATLVIEAGEESGSLITARLTQKFNRKLFAVPGPITSVNSIGTNGLIKEDKAEMVLEAGEILKYFNVGAIHESPANNKRAIRELPLPENNIEQKIINTLKTEPMEIDLLARKLNKNIQEISRQVSLMEIKGQIKKENNKYYVS